MKQLRTSRGVAMLVAVSVQCLVVLALGVGLRLVPVRHPDASTMAVVLVPVLTPIGAAPLSKPRTHVHLRDPGRPPPVVPVDILLPQSVPDPAPPADVAASRTGSNQSRSGIGSDSAIGIVSRVEPDYPASAVQRHAQGTTVVAFRVAANGHPGVVRVLRSSGDAQLDEAAVRAVQRWEFSAALANSQVIPRWGRLDINFNLSRYRKEQLDAAKGGPRHEPDASAALAAAIRNPRNAQQLSPAIRRLLQRSGPVRSIRFIGVSARLPDGVALADPQDLRTLDSSHLAGWNLFEVTQLHGISQWYCAVDAAGHIQLIVPGAD